MKMQVLFAAAIVISIWMLVWWLIRKGRKEYRVEAELLVKLKSLSTERARNEAEAMLANNFVFHCVATAMPSEQDIRFLPRDVQDVFRKYESVETIRVPKMRLDRHAVGASLNHPTYTRIGWGLKDSDSEFEVGIMPGDEVIYELYPNELPDPIFGTFPSIYHWIVQCARIKGSVLGLSSIESIGPNKN